MFLFNILVLLSIKVFIVICYENMYNNEIYGEGYGEDWIYFPDGDGVPHYVSLKGPEDGYPLVRNLYSEIEYRLYTRCNKENYTILDESATLINPTIDINFSKPMKIITHGWRSSIDSPAVADIKNAYVENLDVNVITVDWSYTAGSIFYHWVANQTHTIGIEIAAFLNALYEKHKVTGDLIHLIGHSLGAHIMGIAAYYSNMTIGRVTGLDPARPLFEYPSRDDTEKLDSSDAKFVDIIHTCAGVLGFETSIGTVDFYPNSGIPPQPGCETLPRIIEACSHGRSYYYFAESISRPYGFPSLQCRNWTFYLENHCGPYIYMGEKVNQTISGNFFLETNSKQPFGRAHLHT